jgi:hypothetical protein
MIERCIHPEDPVIWKYNIYSYISLPVTINAYVTLQNYM